MWWKPHWTFSRKSWRRLSKDDFGILDQGWTVEHFQLFTNFFSLLFPAGWNTLIFCSWWMCMSPRKSTSSSWSCKLVLFRVPKMSHRYFYLLFLHSPGWPGCSVLLLPLQNNLPEVCLTSQECFWFSSSMKARLKNVVPGNRLGSFAPGQALLAPNFSSQQIIYTFTHTHTYPWSTTSTVDSPLKLYTSAVTSHEWLFALTCHSLFY